jgi:DNA repair protein RecO (recombination protein O)
MLTKDQAICIRTVEYSETSQIVTFFARASGKIGAIAKGSKRPKSSFDGPIEMLSRGRIVFAGANKDNLATLTEFESAAGAAGSVLLRRNLFNLNCCLFGAELVSLLTDEHDPHPNLFDSFLGFLHNAENAREKCEMLALLILFQLALLKEAGLGHAISSSIDSAHSVQTAPAGRFFFVGICVVSNLSVRRLVLLFLFLFLFFG